MTVDPQALTAEELRWLANQQKKARGSRSKYVPHQNLKEKARRLRQAARAAR